MDADTIRWIKAVLANDEYSSDEEMQAYFVKEGGMTPEEAAKWVALRDQYLRELFCNAEPDDNRIKAA